MSLAEPRKEAKSKPLYHCNRTTNTRIHQETTTPNLVSKLSAETRQASFSHGTRKSEETQTLSNNGQWVRILRPNMESVLTGLFYSLP
jgi:hypothetical protein